MDILERLIGSPLGRSLLRTAGLPEATLLRRGRTWPDGPLIGASLSGSRLGEDTIALLGRHLEPALTDHDGEPVGYPAPIGALIVDALGLQGLDQGEDLRAVLRPALRSLAASGRVILLADPPASATTWQAAAIAQGVDGVNRTIAKELRKGATSTLVQVLPGTTAADLASTLAFCLQGRSAFVDGQTWQVGPAGVGAPQSESPLAGRLIAVTGAARGIGAAITATLARDGAEVLAIDMPASGEALAKVANQVGGTALQLDITSPDAGVRIAAAASQLGSGRLHGIVHNAGITRDKLLVNTDAARWQAVIQVNLAAQLAINEVLLDPNLPGGLADHGRIVGLASTSGIAGNRGQTNYAASKAGVIGLVRAMAPDLAARGITVNAVAPGFIETAMTARIPTVQREVFRRTNSLSQGGQPVDVAETIGYFLDPGSDGVNGQVIRVCGQNLVGA